MQGNSVMHWPLPLDMEAPASLTAKRGFTEKFLLEQITGFFVSVVWVPIEKVYIQPESRGD